MFLPGQIVYDLDLKIPIQVFDPWSLAPRQRLAHFLKATKDLGYITATPASLAEAVDLLAKGIISPAPCSTDRCWRCLNTKSNCRLFRCMAGKEQIAS